MGKEQTIQKILDHKIIAIVRNVKQSDMILLGQALHAGGIRLMEVTFDQSKPSGTTDTFQAIQCLTQYFGEDMCIGAGTVMSVPQVQMAYEAGAGYIISPNTNKAVIDKTISLGVVSIPGALTPTEAAFAYDSGADFVKLFPAGELGISYIKAVMAPLNHIPFLAVGGIQENNMKDFLAMGVKGFGIGSNIVKGSLIHEGKFDQITRLAKAFVDRLLTH